MKTIACLIPLSWEYVPRSFFVSYSNMKDYSIGKYHLLLCTGHMCYIDKCRDELVETAFKHQADYMLWLDADQTYPHDTPEILMKHMDDGKAIVGGVTPRRDSGLPSIYRYHNEQKRYEIILPELYKGLIKIDAMGFGGVMTDIDIFDFIEYPYFQIEWGKGNYTYGEDFTFFRKCKEANIDIWCDTNLIYEHLSLQTIKIVDPKTIKR